MQKQLFLPENYTRRDKPEYFKDNTRDVYQPDVYTFLKNLSFNFDAKKIVDIGCGNGDKLAEIKNVYTVGIDFGENIKLAQKKYPGNHWIDLNIEKDLNSIKNIVKDGWIICSDVIEHLIDPSILLDFFSEVLPSVYGIVISTPERDRARGKNNLGPPANLSHVAEWNKEEFYQLLTHNNLKPLLHGYTRSNDNDNLRNTQVAFILGGLLNLKPTNIRVLAIVPCFNEVDIITETVNNLLSQGIDVHVIDNWSTDGSWETLQKYNNIALERFPDSPDDQYNWTGILERIDRLGFTSNYNWILHVDADEQIESPIPNVSVKEFISIAESMGFDVIDFTHLAFRPVENSVKNNTLSNFWQFSDTYGDKTLQRAWKNKKHSMHIVTYGGHVVPLATKEFPIKLILKHYSFRSPEQAKRKIFKNRFPRFINERKKGWHVHYDVFNENHKFLWNQSELNEWNEDTINEWMPEITTKVNLEFGEVRLPKGFN